jgi:hypothetical protein
LAGVRDPGLFFSLLEVPEAGEGDAGDLGEVRELGVGEGRVYVVGGGMRTSSL